ncbi:hypothetical protein M409DRAFT_16682 [Zasmidium cellare ATCC 36951]|uniref:GA4 desaturase n=1 Tax=Zasmidium cellare ATCC 36951 TaxID=1080233 RepID=A0A6A6D2X0_ZASCE|nr:uncharacterized protein M409DRAFT_16682 [Zasmidium cellare ATCC 36951]KAF2172720.1 hypothetical protein M409DRAFT_16682 [Zasmidium cellare ATCC 36951]
MGSIDANGTTAAHGVIRYSEPDDSIPASERSFYSFPASRLVEDHTHELHDLRQSPIKPGAGLDVQGFTWLTHKSALAGDEWFQGRNIEDVYAPEMIKLICEVTGAKRAVVDGFGIRTRSATLQEEKPYDVNLKGDGLDLVVSQLPRDVLRVSGKDRNNAIPPARTAHIDFSVQGLRDTVRWGRQDIAREAQAAIEAEDAGEAPRYAAYSIWRPLKPVKKDPLAMLDWRTVDKSDIAPMTSRALSGIRPEGEYIRTGLSHGPPKNPEMLKWYWIPSQQPDEVVILKFSDTSVGDLGENKPDIAAHCVHGSPVIPGMEDVEARESIECRIIAFWD